MSTLQPAADPTQNVTPPPDQMSFESAMAELEHLIQSVESNRFSLEDTLATYQRGQQLLHRCNTLLKDAETRLEQFDSESLHDATIAERA